MSSDSSVKQCHRNNYDKVRIDKTQQNTKSSLCYDREETINHLIIERSKLGQRECKTRYDKVGKMIHWEFCQKLKFDKRKK